MAEAEKIFREARAEDSSGFLLWQVTNLWQREIRNALEPLGLTHSQFVLLASTAWLSSKGNEVTQIVLSQHSKIDPMTTSTVLRALQKKGWLQRHEHTTDTRAKTVVLTPQGKKLVKEAVKIVEDFDQAFFAALGKDLRSFNGCLLSLLEQKD